MDFEWTVKRKRSQWLKYINQNKENILKNKSIFEEVFE